MASLGNFNANEVAPSTGEYEPIPDGTEVELQAISEELSVNSKNTGEILKLEYEVIAGEFQGRKLRASINITHNNPVAQKIGQEELSALCHAIGELNVQDTEELLWKPFRALVGIEEYTKRDGTPGLSNKVKKYLFEVDGAPPEQKAAATPPAQTPRAAAPAQRAAAPASRAAPARAAGGAAVPWKRGG